jgi:hypothetical protein
MSWGGRRGRRRMSGKEGISENLIGEQGNVECLLKFNSIIKTNNDSDMEF